MKTIVRITEGDVLSIVKNTLNEIGNRKILISEAKVSVLKKYHPNIDDDTFYMIVKANPKWRETNADAAGGYTKWLLDLYEKDRI